MTRNLEYTDYAYTEGNAIAIAESQIKQSQAQVAGAGPNLAIAEVNLSYTVVRAPHDGFVAERKSILEPTSRPASKASTSWPRSFG